MYVKLKENYGSKESPLGEAVLIDGKYKKIIVYKDKWIKIDKKSRQMARIGKFLMFSVEKPVLKKEEKPEPVKGKDTKKTVKKGDKKGK